MPRAINEQVAVVTGASSGNGRETALEFARRGACVVLAARREDLLGELADARGVREVGQQEVAFTRDRGRDIAVYIASSDTLTERLRCRKR